MSQKNTIFLAAIAALYVVMSVNSSVCLSIGPGLFISKELQEMCKSYKRLYNLLKLFKKYSKKLVLYF